MTNYCHRQLKEEESWCNAAVEAFQVVEKSLKETKKNLLEEEKERKFAAAALESAEKQVKTQRLQLQDVEDELAATKT